MNDDNNFDFVFEGRATWVLLAILFIPWVTGLLTITTWAARLLAGALQ
jgi:hypothetical protein